MIHVVFNQPDVEVLQSAIALDGSLEGEVVLIRDDYAVGPLENCENNDGWKNRRAWWQKVISVWGEEQAEELLKMVDDKMEVHQLKKKLTENEKEVIWIWAAQNKHDVSGYYWLVSQLADYQGRIFILYLNNLPFFNEKGGIFYPQWLSQIPPKEYLKAKKLARPITPSEFEVDTDEWNRLAAMGKMVRLLEGGKKLVQQDVHYYDAALAMYVSGDFSKSSRIIAQFLSKEKETTGDIFLYWRLQALIQQNGYEVKGDINKNPKEYELRDPQKPSLKKKSLEDSAA